MAAYVFNLPDVGEGTAEAEVAAWHVQVGDSVKEDQPLVDVMSEKATVEITSPITGLITALHSSVGEMAAVGGPLVTFTLKEEQRDPLPRPDPAGSQGKAEALDPSGNRPITLRPIASPAVHRRAREMRMSLKLVRGSGPNGRILEQDLVSAMPNAVADRGHSSDPRGGTPERDAPQEAFPSNVFTMPDQPGDEVRIIGLRRKIAERMSLAKRNIPHFTYVEEIDLTELELLRANLNARFAGARVKLTPLPFIMRAVATVLPKFPDINATYDGHLQVLSRRSSIHMGIATQTPNGLLVPVIRRVETRDLWDCASELARLASVARQGRATREELSGSTITLTSLGPLGGIAATPVINYPEVAIIGPNRIVDRAVVRGGVILVRKMMNLSSSFDHRIVDGHQAAQFVGALKEFLETPSNPFITPICS